MRLSILSLFRIKPILADAEAKIKPQSFFSLNAGLISLPAFSLFSHSFFFQFDLPKSNEEKEREEEKREGCS